MLYVFSTFSAPLFFGDSPAMPWYITTFLSVKICIDKKGMIREKCWYIWGAWENVTKNENQKRPKKQGRSRPPRLFVKNRHKIGISFKDSMQSNVKKIASFYHANGGILNIWKAPSIDKNAISCSPPPTFSSPQPTTIPPQTHPIRPRQTPWYSYIPALKNVSARTEHRTNTI